MRRKYMLKISKELNELYHKPRVLIILDMIYCSLYYGAMFSEYGDLGFYFRSHRNRKTYLTTFYNFKLYNKVNDKKLRILFHDKLQFLSRFSHFIKRKWININTSTDSEINNFLKEVKSVVLKASYGDSGKEIEVIDVTGEISAKEIRQKANMKKYNLMEECVTNHPAIAALNPNSLNTLRIVSMRKNDNVKILFAGLRVGAKGARIDNISQGGSVARIDIKTGKVNSRFYTKASYRTSSVGNECFSSHIVGGIVIPYWEKTLSLIQNVALEVSGIRFVAWDVAILPSGPEIIEGNESFGSVIMQLYNTYEEEGLKPVVNAFLG